MNRPRYQLGTLYTEPRRSGPDVWVYRWREGNPQGKRRLRKQILGTVRELRTRTDAQHAAETFRLSINRHMIEQSGPPLTVRKLVEHYRLKELPMDTHEGKTKKTKLVYDNNLRNHILPHWGDYPLRRVNSIDVEEWLKTLKMAPATRTKIRNIMSTVFRHAIRWGWLGQHENPIALVRSGSKRKRIPVTLTAREFRTLFDALPERERAIGVICATTGLRISEVLGLKWEDIRFEAGVANVLRSVVDGSVGPCKTEISQQPVPLDSLTLGELQSWRVVCLYPLDSDWVFASRLLFGRMPVWSNASRQKVLQPAACEAGITKPIGWHTFRHTYSSLLSETGNDVRVVQELMRHAKLSTTMEIYTHARMETKRVAQSKVVDILFDRKPQPELEATA
jgi:integrase